MELIKVRASGVLFEQIALNRYRVFVDNKLVNDTSNAAEAKMWFCGEVGRKLDKHLSEKLRDQGIDPMTGKIGTLKVNKTEPIKVRVSDVLFEQSAINRYRVFVDNKLIKETSNAAEAKMWFCGEVERKLNKYLSKKLRDQGIDPMTGEIGALKVK